MQVCHGRCVKMRVPFRPFMNMYKDHVWCSLCEAYFKKPYPQICICCQTRVRNKARLKAENKVYPGKPPIVHNRGYVRKEILAAQAAGRL